MKDLFIQARSTYGVEKWRKVESHVIREVEEKLWKLDGVQDEEVAPVVIDLTDSDDSDSDMDTDSGDDKMTLTLTNPWASLRSLTMKSFVAYVVITMLLESLERLFGLSVKCVRGGVTAYVPSPL